MHPYPFSTSLLLKEKEGQFSWPFPAILRTRTHDLVKPDRYAIDCIEQELNLQSLTIIQDHLWLAGRPMPPRPLHYQLVLGRNIIITERMEMHLVWRTGQLFLKPIPRFILAARFWKEPLPVSDNPYHHESDEYRDERLRRCARGFLFTYVAMLSHESDFYIAKEKHLIPGEIEWPDWRQFSGEIISSYDSLRVDPRFRYGELRLGRLNKIYFFWQTPLTKHMSSWNQYSSFWRDNFGLLAASTVYLVVVLTALQVGLATKALEKNDSFQRVSYGFAVFSLLAPLVYAGIVGSFFCYIFLNNWVATPRFAKQRMNSGR